MSNTTFSGDTFGINSLYGIYLGFGGINITLSSDYFNDPYGIWINGASSAAVTGNTFTGFTTNHAINVPNNGTVGNLSITGNTFSGSAAGIPVFIGALSSFLTPAVSIVGNSFGPATTPYSIASNVTHLEISGNSSTAIATTNIFQGNVGIGTTTPYSRLEVWGPDTASTSAFAVVNSASTTVFAVYDSGNSTYSGSIFQSSDERLKNDVQSLDASSSLSLLEQLNPVSYLRLDQPGGGENLGFLAQQVGGVFPELVSTTSPTVLTPGGTLTLNYTGFIAPIVSAIQEIGAISGDFEQSLIAWLGNASNGIGDLFATTIHTKNLCAEKSDGTETCVSGDQLAALLASQDEGSSEQGSDNSGDQPTSSPDTPPVIQINGDNPAIIDVGGAYQDLGATITGPQQDLNLGIAASVDGGATTTADQITIDTSQAGTHTILYCAVDQSSLGSCASRTVSVVAPAEDNSAATSTSP